MLLKKLYLAIRHFRWTIICLVIIGIIAVYFDVSTLGAFILAAITGWLQAFIDKVKEIGQQLERERQEEIKTAVREPEIFREPSHPPENREAVRVPQDQRDEIYREPLERVRPRTKEVLVNWREIFSRAKKPFITFALILVLLVIITYVYLYIYF